MADIEKKPSRVITVIGAVIALPFIYLLYFIGANQYVFPAWCGLAAVVVGLLIGLSLRLVRKRSGHEISWVIALLALYNVHMSVGGYLYLNWWALPAAAVVPAVVFFIFRRRSFLWRGLFSFTMIFFLGLTMMQIHRNFDFIDKQELCADAQNRLPEGVTLVVPQPLHPYDFGGVPGNDYIGVAYGEMQHYLFTLYLPSMKLIRGDDAKSGIQRVEPVPGKSLLAMPAWGQRGVEETVYLVDPESAQIRETVRIPGCRNAFETAFINDRMYVLCETSHSLHELQAESPYRLLRSLTLPGMNSYDMAVDGETGRGFITDWLSPYLVEVDLAAMQVTRKKWIGWSALGIAFGPDGMLYVAQPFSRRVRVVEPKDLNIVRTIAAGYGPRDLEFDPERGLLFIGNYFDGTVDVVSLADGGRITRFFAGELLRGIWFDAGGDRLLLATGCGVCLADLQKLLPN